MGSLNWINWQTDYTRLKIFLKNVYFKNVSYFVSIRCPRSLASPDSNNRKDLPTTMSIIQEALEKYKVFFIILYYKTFIEIIAFVAHSYIIIKIY